MSCRDVELVKTVNKNLYNNLNTNSYNILNNNHASFNNCSFQKVNICSFNANGAKRNLSYIQELTKIYDFIFLCETWLLDSEICYLKSLSTSHSVISKSDMSITPINGRPFGGRSFIFNKSLDIKNYSFINKHISFCSFSFHNNVFTIISVHLPFDNKSFLNFSIFTSSLQIIKELFNFFR